MSKLVLWTGRISLIACIFCMLAIIWFPELWLKLGLTAVLALLVALFNAAAWEVKKR